MCACPPHSDRWGAYKALAFGTGLTFMCSLLHFVGAKLSVHNGRYAVVLLGQVLGALAQPFFTNMPANIAGTWFPMSQREIATTIASIFNPLGARARAVFDGPTSRFVLSSCLWQCAALPRRPSLQAMQQAPWCRLSWLASRMTSHFCRWS